MRRSLRAKSARWWVGDAATPLACQVNRPSAFSETAVREARSRAHRRERVGHAGGADLLAADGEEARQAALHAADADAEAREVQAAERRGSQRFAVKSGSSTRERAAGGAVAQDVGEQAHAVRHAEAQAQQHALGDASTSSADGPAHERDAAVQERGVAQAVVA